MALRLLSGVVVAAAVLGGLGSGQSARAKSGVLVLDVLPARNLPAEAALNPAGECGGPAWGGGIGQTQPLIIIAGVSVGYTYAKRAAITDNQQKGRAGLAGCEGSTILSSGERYEYRRDLSIPGRGFDWSFERVYRSGWSFNGPLGSNWDFNYDRRLVVATSGNLTAVRALFPGASVGDVVRLDAYGRTDLYPHNADGSYGSPKGFYTRLTKKPDQSFVERDSRGRAASYSPADSITSVARLTDLSDRNGDTMHFSYNGQGQLTQVLDTLGRPITYSYAGERLTSVQDYAGRTISFTYDGAGNLSTVTSPHVTGTPNGNDFPDGKTERYAYSSGFADGTLNHNLLTITAPNEVATSGPPRVSLTYSTSTSSPAKDRVTSETLGGTNATGVPAGGTTSYGYDAAGRWTVVADPKGNRANYRFTSKGNVQMVTQLTRGLRTGEPPAYQTTYEYNSDGELTLVRRPLGNTVLYTYQQGGDRLGQGNLLATERRPDTVRAGDQPLLRTTRTYEPIYNQPRSSTDPRGHTTSRTFDYEEACDFAAIGARVGRNAAEVAALLSAAGMCASPLGDVNGDGITDQVSGNVVRTDHPTVTLLPGSHQAQVEGDTAQEIVELSSSNEFGQPVRSRDPEQNVTLYEYYSSGPSLGYLRLRTRDAVAGAGRDSGTNPPPTSIRRQYVYDEFGNLTREVDGRGIATDYAVNQLNQVVQVTRAAAHGIFTPDPPEPETPTDFHYLRQYFYDANDNLVRKQVEDRGATSDTGPFAESLYQYDILDQRTDARLEVVSGTFVETRYRYDANGNRVLVIQPEGNATSSAVDERDLLLRRTEGAIAPPPGALLGSSDPTGYDVRGGSPATTTYHYDDNGNVNELVDASDTDGSAASNSDRGGSGDRTRYVYDGFDRRTSRVDSVGNQTVYQYDAADNVVRTSHFGPVGGASPASDGPDALPSPVSALGVIQSGNLVSSNLLAATEQVYDEADRPTDSNGVLFVNTIPTMRPADVADGATDLGRGNLTPGDNQPIPGVTGISILGRVTTRAEYDRSSRPTFTDEDDGDTSRTFYDGADRTIKTLDPEGNTVETAYDDEDNVIETRATDLGQIPVPPEVFLTTSFYDSLGRLQRRVDNLGQTFDYRYDSRDNLVARADAKGPAGPAISRRAFPDGPSTVNATNLFGNVTLRYYDGLSRRTRQESILTASGEGDGAHIGATLEGVKTTTPPPDPSQGGGDGIDRSGQTWDGNSLPSASLDDQGNVSVTLHDNLERSTLTSDGLIATTPLTKSRLLGPRVIPTPTPATINDPAVIPTAKINAQLSGAASRLSPIASLFPSLADRVDDNPPATTVSGLDPDGHVLISEDANDSETFSKLDAVDRPIAQRIFRAGQSDSFAGDPLFAPAPVSDPSNPRGTPSAVVGTTTRDYEYDGLSRLVRATDNNEPGTTADDSVNRFAFDSIMHRIEDRQLLGLRDRAVDRSWRAEDLSKSLTYPNGRVVGHTYDGLDRVATMEGSTAHWTYIGPDRILQRLNGNGTRSTYEYDGAGRVASIDHVNDNTGATIAGFTYAYDRMGNATSEGKTLDPGNDESWGFASDYRVRGFDRPPGGIPASQGSWLLDGVGNWRTVSGASGVETRAHSSLNEIISRTGPLGPVNVLSDGNGNEVDDGVAHTFAWDSMGDLRTVGDRVTGNPIGQYSYDAAGRRVLAIQSGSAPSTRDFYYDSTDVIEERDGADALVQQNMKSPDILSLEEVQDNDGKRAPAAPVAVDRNLDGNDSAIDPTDQRLFYHQNAAGSTFALTDSTGAIAESYPAYEAYGKVDSSAPSAVGNPYLWRGNRLDSESGLLFDGSDYMDTEQGRAISVGVKVYSRGGTSYNDQVTVPGLPWYPATARQVRLTAVLRTPRGEDRLVGDRGWYLDDLEVTLEPDANAFNVTKRNAITATRQNEAAAMKSFSGWTFVETDMAGNRVIGEGSGFASVPAVIRISFRLEDPSGIRAMDRDLPARIGSPDLGLREKPPPPLLPNLPPGTPYIGWRGRVPIVFVLTDPEGDAVSVSSRLLDSIREQDSSFRNILR